MPEYAGRISVKKSVLGQESNPHHAPTQASECLWPWQCLSQKELRGRQDPWTGLLPSGRPEYLAVISKPNRFVRWRLGLGFPRKGTAHIDKYEQRRQVQSGTRRRDCCLPAFADKCDIFIECPLGRVSLYSSVHFVLTTFLNQDSWLWGQQLPQTKLRPQRIPVPAEQLGLRRALDQGGEAGRICLPLELRGFPSRFSAVCRSLWPQISYFSERAARKR